MDMKATIFVREGGVARIHVTAENSQMIVDFLEGCGCEGQNA